MSVKGFTQLIQWSKELKWIWMECVSSLLLNRDLLPIVITGNRGRLGVRHHCLYMNNTPSKNHRNISFCCDRATHGIRCSVKITCVACTFWRSFCLGQRIIFHCEFVHDRLRNQVQLNLKNACEVWKSFPRLRKCFSALLLVYTVNHSCKFFLILRNVVCNHMLILSSQ
mgnify:CR=1 FL=1